MRAVPTDRVLAARGHPFEPFKPVSASSMGSETDQAKAQRFAATALAHLPRMQADVLNRPAVTKVWRRVTAAYGRGDGRSEAGHRPAPSASSALPV